MHQTRGEVGKFQVVLPISVTSMVKYLESIAVILAVPNLSIVLVRGVLLSIERPVGPLHIDIQ